MIVDRFLLGFDCGHVSVRLMYVRYFGGMVFHNFSFLALPYMYRTARQLCLLQVKVAVTRLWSFFSGETLM